MPSASADFQKLSAKGQKRKETNCDYLNRQKVNPVAFSTISVLVLNCWYISIGDSRISIGGLNLAAKSKKMGSPSSWRGFRSRVCFNGRGGRGVARVADDRRDKANR